MINDKTEATKSPLQWMTPKQFAAIKLKPDQLVLYDFSAAWCGPCKIMDKTTFRDKNVINELNNHFILVRVMDPGVTASIPERAEIKHLQQRYEVLAFPQFDATLANGVSISSRVGYLSPRQIMSFLLGAEKKGGFFAGRSLIMDHPRQAAVELEQWLRQSEDWEDSKGGLATAYACVCYRIVHDEVSAKRVLELAQRQLPKEMWPRSLIDYLHGERSLESVLDEASGDDVNVTDAKGIVAMNMRAQGKIAQSNALLEWVKDNGSHSCFSYDWALAVLKQEAAKN
jgi:thiol-disulfide isomerase/thioredoxin